MNEYCIYAMPSFILYSIMRVMFMVQLHSFEIGMLFLTVYLWEPYDAIEIEIITSNALKIFVYQHSNQSIDPILHMHTHI